MTHTTQVKHKKLALLAKKIGMTQVYDEQGRLIPVTAFEAGPCTIVQIKSLEKDCYQAIQIGFEEAKEKHLTQAEMGHFKKANLPLLSHLTEIRLGELDGLKVGDVFTVSDFSEQDKVDIIGFTIGRGFQGVVKRYGFAGQPATHGAMMHRRPGSIGMRQTPGHVYKQRKMPGHQGCRKRTVQNLSVIKIIPEKNLILIKGSCPGSVGSLMTIRTAKKTKITA